MSSERTPARHALRRLAPWALYAAAAAAALPLWLCTAGMAPSPAEAEVRRVALSAPRTPHRLRVEEVRVAPGDAVATGQVVARMESAELDAELAAARRRLEELQLAVGAVEGRRRDDRVQAGDQLERQAEEARVTLARLAAEEDRGRSELRELEAAIAAEEALVADRVASRERLEGLKLKRAALAAELVQLRGAVEQARRAAGAASVRFASWSGAPGGGPPGARIEEAVAPARAAAEAQRERVRALEAAAARLTLSAPFDGRVEEVLLRPGETAGADGAVVTLVDEHPRRAVVWVDQLFATRVHLGDLARLVPRDGSGPPLGGRVVALAPAVTEIPARFAPLPALPRWGRAVYVELDAPAALPGQAFDATFRPAPAGPGSPP